MRPIRTVQIVIAWTEITELEKTGRMIQKDGVNWFPEYRPALAAKAAMWKIKGSLEDVKKAEKALESIASDAIASAVYVIPAEDRNPLATARAWIRGVGGSKLVNAEEN